MSEKFRKDRFFGVERADSLTWNPHKLLGALLQCSTFHLKVKVARSKLQFYYFTRYLYIPAHQTFLLILCISYFEGNFE